MRRRLALLAGTIAMLGTIAAVLPAWLVASDPTPARADAIFVFAGEVPERARCAAELYRRGLAPVLVFSGGNVRPELLALGLVLPDAAVGALVAAEAGVPRTAEIVLPAGTSTWEDAGVLRGWAAASGARSVVAVTSPLHARRARHALRLALEPSGIAVSVLACGGSRFPPGSAWWREERSLVAVSNEALKLAFYGLRYFAPAAFGLGPRPQDLGEVP